MRRFKSIRHTEAGFRRGETRHSGDQCAAPLPALPSSFVSPPREIRAFRALANMEGLVPQEGPPTSVEISGALYKILRNGLSVAATQLKKDDIDKNGLTWDSVTWVYRQSADGDTYATYPLIWTHRGDITFLTPALAASIDEVTAEKAARPVAELDREEKVVLRSASGEEITVPRIPSADALAPRGYVAPKPAKRGKDAKVVHSDGEGSEEEDEDAKTPKKKLKGKDGQPVAKSKGEAKASASCAWFVRMRTVAGAFDRSVKFKELLPAPATPSAAPPKPAAEAASKPASKPSSKPASKSAAEPKPSVKPAAPKPVTKGAAGKFASMYKTVPAPEVPAYAAKKPAPAPTQAKAGGSKPASNNAVARAFAPGGEDALFTFRKGNHQENVRMFFSYLLNTPDTTPEVKAMVKCLWNAAKEKPDETGHVFRAAGLPVERWTTDGLKSIHGLTKDQEHEVRRNFVAARAVFAEILAKPAEPSGMNVDDW